MLGYGDRKLQDCIEGGEDSFSAFFGEDGPIHPYVEVGKFKEDVVVGVED